MFPLDLILRVYLCLNNMGHQALFLGFYDIGIYDRRFSVLTAPVQRSAPYVGGDCGDNLLMHIDV